MTLAANGCMMYDTTSSDTSSAVARQGEGCGVTTLSITLFGSFQATLDGWPGELALSPPKSALCWLTSPSKPTVHSRDELVGLLWPDQPDSTVRTNLRQALANLRLALGDREATAVIISNTSEGIQFLPYQRSCH